MSGKKIYRVLDDIMYCGSPLPIGSRSDLATLSKEEIVEKLKMGVIIDNDEYEKQIQKVDDADDTAKNIIENAKKEAAKIINEAKAAPEEKADKIILNAEDKAKSIIDEAEAKATKIIEEAEKTAKTNAKENK